MERIHIGIFGRCNAGKSTLMNLLAGGDVAATSPVGGTTTDPVRKRCEVADVGPVVFVDTAGADDTSELGTLRVGRMLQAVEQVDMALLVYREWGAAELELMAIFERAGLPVVRVHNVVEGDFSGEGLNVDALGGDPAPVFEAIRGALTLREARSMFGDRVGEGDRVVLVTPIDSSAPEGRLILPQVQAIRELLDRRATAVVVQPGELAQAVRMAVPRLVVADSQVLKEVRETVGEGVEVTTFSILLAASRGDRELYERGLEAVDGLKDGDRVLVAESCTHQTSCDDIGRVKIPRWLEEYTGARLDFTTVSGLAPLPADLENYALAVQCGGCMITRGQLLRRLRAIAAAGVPVTNYGMLIQKIRG